VKAHPAARAELAQVEVVHARQRVLDRAYFPRLSVQSALFARGTGAEVPDQSRIGDGLWPQVSNWAMGVSVNFPAFDLFALRARKRLELQNLLAENARYDETIEGLTTQGSKPGH
jgi:outer membrane protein TolC